MANILAIDDDPDILQLIQNALGKDGHRVDTALSTQGISAEKIRFADLILLDVMMPNEDGFAFCERIRHEVDSPILFLTAHTEENALIHGLGIGGDDYIQKPFTLGELRARIAAHLRREKREHSHALRIGSILLDISAKRIRINDAVIPFTKGEYAICAFLMEHAGQVFSKGQIYEAVFGFDREADDSAITEHIKNIRAKLRLEGQEPIETIWGIGYTWKKGKASH